MLKIPPRVRFPPPRHHVSAGRAIVIGGRVGAPVSVTAELVVIPVGVPAGVLQALQFAPIRAVLDDEQERKAEDVFVVSDDGSGVGGGGHDFVFQVRGYH